MARLSVVVACLLMNLCAYSRGPGEIDPAKIKIQRCSANSVGLLVYEENVILTFPCNDQVQIINTVKTARQNNWYLFFEDIPQENGYGQEPMWVKTMRCGSPILNDTWIKLPHDQIESHRKGLLRNFPYISYQLLKETFEINIYYEEIHQHLLSTIAEAKRKKVDITINYTALKCQKKQQYLRGDKVAFVVNQ